VEYAHPNYLYYPDTIVEPNDGGYPQQYNLKTIKAPRAWSISTGSDVIIATVDSGTDASHPDLSPNIIGSFDLVDGKHAKDDPTGHGTLVSGVMTGVGNNGQAGAGVAWRSKLLTYRVGDETLKDSDISKGIRAATDAGARVINLSLGGSQAGATIKAAVQYAIDKGVIIVASSGNSGNDVTNYPASLPGVISVGALGKQGVPAYFSSYGSFVTITAPGVSICGTFRTSKFGCADGTSFSAPTISGVVALMLSVNPNLTRDQVKAILIATATPAPGKQVGQQDPKYGYGTVNAFAAVRAVATGQFFALPEGIRP
jgi:subtilisin family serine protease